MRDYLKMKNNINSNKHNVKISLSDDDERFISFMAKRDNVSFQEELQMIFYTELRQLIDLYESELKGE